MNRPSLPTWKLIGITLLLSLSSVTTAGVIPFSLDFVYQGRLEQSGVPADGSYDFRFALYRGATSTQQVGMDEFAIDVPVTEGVFTALVPLGYALDGTDLWLEVAVREQGGGAYTTLSPRHQLRAAPFAVSAAELDHLIGEDEVLSSELQLRVDSICPAGQAIRAIDTGGEVLCQSTAGSGWSLTGNAGTVSGTNFLGTTDNEPLALRVNDERVMRFDWASFAQTSAPNIIGGHAANSISGGNASTIGGGGLGPAPNTIDAQGATIAGGINNTVTGPDGAIGGGSSNSVAGEDAVIPGGSSNVADGENSFAAGVNARAMHDNSFVWNDGNDIFESTGAEQFLIDAARVGIGENQPSDFLHLNAPAGSNAMRVQIDGQTKLRVHDNGGVSVGVNTTPPANGLEVQGDAQFRGSIEYNTPLTRHWSITGDALNAITEDVTYRAADGTLDCLVGQEAFGVFLAFGSPVHLPQGARVTGLHVGLNDSTVAGGDLTAVLVRRSLVPNSGREIMANTQSAGTPGATTISDTSIADEFIDNRNYAYALRVQWNMPSVPIDIGFCSARIEYEVSTPAP